MTPTERTVADLVTEGLTCQEIGERLYVSRRTVETHVRHIFDKLGVRSPRNIAALARSTGKTPLPTASTAQ